MNKAGFLYFFPTPKDGTGKIELSDLESLGLGYAFTSKNITRCEVAKNGPDGGSGVILADGVRVGAQDCRVNVAEQVWRQIPKMEVWVGFWKSKRPRPDDLLRPDALKQGYPITMANGEMWSAPIARGLSEYQLSEERKKEIVDSGDTESTVVDDDGNMFILIDYCPIPKGMDMDDDGGWSGGKILPQYQSLYDMALTHWSYMCGEEVDGEVSFDYNARADAAVRALQANYFVGKAEVALLGIFDEKCVSEVLDALVDSPVIRAWHKKKASLPVLDGSGSSDGTTEETDTTDPA